MSAVVSDPSTVVTGSSTRVNAKSYRAVPFGTRKHPRKEDSDTPAKINERRLYSSSVQGIRVNITDITSTWIAIKGWLTSDEGQRIELPAL